MSTPPTHDNPIPPAPRAGRRRASGPSAGKEARASAHGARMIPACAGRKAPPPVVAPMSRVRRAKQFAVFTRRNTANLPPARGSVASPLLPPPKERIPMHSSHPVSLLVAALVMLRAPCSRGRATARLLLERAAGHDELSLSERDACLSLADEIDLELQTRVERTARPGPSGAPCTQASASPVRQARDPNPGARR